jgi:AcrR family transcriptional regulator
MQRAMRVDAARNHDRIVATAGAAFEELGAGVALEEVARRAGVGVATLYRRFRNRDQLVRAVFVHVFATEIRPAAGTGDPWRDLVHALEATVESVAAHRVMIRLAHEAGAIDVDVVQSYLSSMDRLLARASDAGLVRPELVARRRRPRRRPEGGSGPGS